MDYVLVDSVMLYHLGYLYVHDLRGAISDHCLVYFGLAVKVTAEITKSRSSLMLEKFKWHDRADIMIRNVLRADTRIGEVKERKIDKIDDALNILNDVITTAASKGLLKAWGHKKVKNKR